ncbi:hypothetical protein BpHYR1_004241 [Brachionus plicatilis]|uniref:Uncharacterized protein n=1 Tax=Brachionus plicatilis TaxID=10195 RepID=A0A3M7QCQ7_BRAPC|nr:hypothetical protein BpHYR1_004241 [Brachionus plicatilis]
MYNGSLDLVGKKKAKCNVKKILGGVSKDLCTERIWVFWIVERFRELGILLNSYSIKFVRIN